MPNNDSLGDRMKAYENISRFYLARHIPVIIRIDGKAFHSFTKGFQRPFDDVLITVMQKTAKYLCENIQGCKLAYIQSDEISLLLMDNDSMVTEPWFGKNLQKTVSIAASMATMAFNKYFITDATEYIINHNNGSKLNQNYIAATENGAMFDARAFIIPEDEIVNYFIWRQQDATRNSIQMVAQSKFSHKELQGKNCNELQDMLYEKQGINWNDYDTVYKRGSCIIKNAIDIPISDNGIIQEVIRRFKWQIDKNIPIFTQDRSYIMQTYSYSKEEN